MKKNIFFMLLILTLFMSCSGSDDESTESLNGTTWVSPDDGDGVRTIVFGSTTFSFKIEYAGNVDSSSGTYTYNPPKVVLTQGGVSWPATISGSKMTTDTTEDGDYVIYYKK